MLYAKAEHLNLTGSVKDRMALHILMKAYASGALQPRAPIIEATSGNTGIAFAALGRALGHPVTVFMPDWMSGAVVMTLFPDDNKKYLSTDLLKIEPMRPDHLTPDVELIGFHSVRRTCAACWDPAVEPHSGPRADRARRRDGWGTGAARRWLRT